MPEQKISPIDTLPPGKKIYFASDFHLGAGSAEQSKQIEKKVVSWLDHVQSDAHSIFLVGDMFDFWFEYKTVIPKGFSRFQGKLAQLSDEGIKIHCFTGNHDMWLFDYFPKEFNIPVYRKPQKCVIGKKKFLIGHGDGLGPGDHLYKMLKMIFDSKICQWLFARLHPNFGVGIANFWSRRSRISNMKKEDPFLGDDEWLFQYCSEIEQKEHHDYYIFGHRHLKLDMQVNENSRYINLGEWVTSSHYACFDGEKLELNLFRDEE